jgi:hypothetical protein
MLGKAQAIADEPYQVYQGPMTAGQSGLQSKVFQGLGNLSFPGILGQSFSSPMRSQQPQMQPQTMPAYRGQQPYPVQIPGTGGGMPPPGGFPGYDPYAGRQDAGAAINKGYVPGANPRLDELSGMGGMNIGNYAAGATGATGNNGEDGGPIFSSTGLMGSADTDIMPTGMPMQSAADIAFEKQFAQQGPSVGGVANAVNAPSSSLVQQNDPFYQSPEYKQFQSETEGGFGTMDMYDSPNFGSIGSGTTGRAMDEAYEKYKAGLPAQAETPAFNQLDPSSQMVYAGGSKDFDFRGGSYGDTPEDFGVPYNPADFKQPPSMDSTGQMGTAQQGGIAGLSLQPPQGSQQPSNIAQSYMNPYLQSVLDPQMAELRRQNDITNMQANAKLTGAGAFGGGRQAIMNAENNRNLMMEQNKTVGQGYANAYDKAMQQFNTEQGQAKTLAEMMAEQGQQERNIEQQGISADYNEFLAQRDDPMKKTQYLQSMLQGLPIQTVTNTGGQLSGIGQLAQTVGGLGSISDSLKKFNLTGG